MTTPIIDKTDGRLRLSDDFSVSDNTTVEELVSELGAEKFESIDIHPDWAHCKNCKIKREGEYFLFDFFFKNDRLHYIVFIVSNKPIVTGNWDNWSEKEERENKKKYDEWLSTQLGSYRKFKWGVIEATYDVRTGGSSISLSYTV